MPPTASGRCGAPDIAGTEGSDRSPLRGMWPGPSFDPSRSQVDCGAAVVEALLPRFRPRAVPILRIVSYTIRRFLAPRQRRR